MKEEGRMSIERQRAVSATGSTDNETPEGGGGLKESQIWGGK